MSLSIEGGSPDDRSAIEALHRADEEASRSQDRAALRRLMSDDAAIMAPGARAIRGRAALDRAFGGVDGAEPPPVEVTAYAFRWEEVRVVGDFAWEWGRVEGASRPRGSREEPRPLAYNVMRILRREAGGWKVHRTIWNEAPAG